MAVVVVARDAAATGAALAGTALDAIGAGVIEAVRPGASPKRNQGVRHLLAASVPWDALLFLDDDVELEPDYVALLAGHLGADASLAGAAGVSVGDPEPVPAWLRVHRRVFVGREDGSPRLTSGGINVPIGPEVREPRRADWLFGCAMYRRSVAQRCAFDESMAGYWLLDDVEYSLQAGRLGGLVVDPAARLVHHEAPGERPDARALARQVVLTRHELLRRHRPGWRSTLGFWWTSLGEGLLWVLGAAAGRPLMRERLRGGLGGLTEIALRRGPRS